MTPEREREAARICEAALNRPAAERTSFVAGECAGDDALCREVESLLQQQSKADAFLQTPALNVAAEQLLTRARLAADQQVGPYQIQGLLGAGGMGEVYRARDAKLGRDVAIKILPRLFVTDPERLARFDREARVLASLNHPNIAAIYGLENVDGTPALVLELVDGVTLSDRLEKGALSVHDALTVGAQVVLALEAAHEKGIVHRDLKPANIEITAAGIVKVLDFGLAKAVAGDASTPDLSQSVGGTKAGVILGTAAYMSPEQARGKPVDKRADVWAFGCVLYEMLTGRAVFPGDTLSDTIASILKGEPDWQSLPATTPASIRRLLRRCLEKDPTRRLRDIGDARFDIDEAMTTSETTTIATSPSVARRWLGRVAWVLTLIGIAAAVGVTVLYFRDARTNAPQKFRFTLEPPPNTVVEAFALSPDGQRLVFITVRAGTRMLWVRSLDALEAQSLPDTEGAEAAFWSPDSLKVAFVVNRKLKTIDVGGGSSHTLCDLDGQFRGGAWSPDGTTLVFATLPHGLFSVPATGGATTPLANPDATSADAPSLLTILPDGRHFIYLSVPSRVAWLGSLDSTKRPVRLFDTTFQVEYVEPGYLVFVRRGSLMVQRFDAERATLTAEAVPIAEAVQDFTTSLNGTVVYRSDPLNVHTQLTWVNRAGKQIGTLGSPGRYRNPELSPDGASVAMGVIDAQSARSDIGRLDVGRGVMDLLTSDPGNDGFPVWSPDGTWIMFSSNRDGAVPQLYRMRANGTGGQERISPSKTGMVPQGWSPDGRFLVYQNRPAFKLWLLPSSDGVPRTFEDSTESSIQGFGQVSPDGRWLTYGSSQGGPGWDIYVQSFPMPGHGKWRVSGDWGASPRWSRDGREIFYYARDRQLMAVPVINRGSGLEFGRAVPLFEASLLGGPNPVAPIKQQYDVAIDGRFLLNVPVEQVSSQSLTVVVNSLAALRP